MRTLLLALMITVPLAAQRNNLAALNEGLIQLSERLTPSVVFVIGNAYAGANEIDEEPVSLRQSAGAGVIVSADGYIVTNAHVVAGASRIRVHLPSLDPKEGRSVVRPRAQVVPGRVVGIDVETDLAVLKVDATGLPFLTFGDSETVRQGQLVVALGHPRGLEGSVTLGVISGVARQLRPDDRVIYLQTDAPINPGNSGGPLVDVEGNVIGINTMIISSSRGSEGLGFAVPSNIVRYVTEEIRKHGIVTRGDIGADAQTITPTLASVLGLEQSRGIVLADVHPKGPADNAGLMIGDIVLALDGKPMENARQFHVNLYQRHVPGTVTLQILRKGETTEKTVVVLDRRDDPERFASLVNDRQHLVPRLGILAVDIDSKVSALFPLALRRQYGILVARLAGLPDGPSRAFERGDVIYEFNGQPVSTLPELRAMLAKIPSAGPVVLQIERQGRIRFIELTLD